MPASINSSVPRPLLSPAELGRATQDRASAQAAANTTLERDAGTTKPAVQSAQELRQRNREAREARETQQTQAQSSTTEERETRETRRNNTRSREIPTANGSEPQRRPQPGRFLDIVV